MTRFSGYAFIFMNFGILDIFFISEDLGNPIQLQHTELLIRLNTAGGSMI